MKIITDSTTLVANPDWSILNNMPIQFSIDATENEIEIVLPSISTIVSGVTLITFQVIGDNSVTIRPTDDNSIDFLNTSILLEKEKLYQFSIANSTNWSVIISPSTSSIGDFIPRLGTLEGFPVEGDVQLQSGKRFKCRNANDDGWNYMTVDDGGFSVTLENTSLGNISLSFGGSGLFSAYIIPLFDDSYIQRKYVDNTMISLDYGTIKNAGGIENVQVYTTGTGTGTASVDLSPIMVIGKDVTVSDLGNNASTHNIQIDAGLGNTILYNGVASQDIILDTNGASVTIRKMTANQFMVIAKN